MKSKLLATALFLAAPLTAHACAATDFTIEGFEVKTLGNRMVMSGHLVNKCSTAAAAQISIEAKNESGNVLQTKKGWPAGTTNIGPGESVTFDMGKLFRPDASMHSYTVAVVDVRTW